MEKRDEDLIQRYYEQDPELKALVDEHKRLDDAVDELGDRPYLTPEETLEEKKLKRQKLLLKDKIEVRLASYRS